ELLVDLKDYQSENTVFYRTAVRGIIKHGSKYLVIHSKYGEYKFPGGGMHDNETLTDTLLREVKEETGYSVKKDSIHEYLKVTEKRKGLYADIMIMVSYYYFCDVEEQVGERNLDDYEKEYDYQVAWMPLEEIIACNENLSIERIHWIVRETTVMKELLAEQ
ncbi:MAG: NUDIX domain-containing protein, partial [Acutalibacteraceae bacterium]